MDLSTLRIQMSYNADSIKSIDPIAHIRLRPGMYIPDVGIQGLHHLLEEVINNSVDEFMSGHGKEITISINNNVCTVTDNGRGIPPDKLINVVTKTLTGGKFDSSNYNTSSGLNGIGLKAVNALSKTFKIYTIRDGFIYSAAFTKGKLTKETKDATKLSNGTGVEFFADDSIFETIDFDVELLKTRLSALASILPGLKIILDTGSKEEYYETEHLESIQKKAIDKDSIFEFRSSGNSLYVRLNYCPDSNTSISSFVNTIHTYEDGSHVDAVFEAMSAALKRITGRPFSRTQVAQGIRLSISVFYTFPVFRGQHKGKLADNRIKKMVYDSIYEDLYKALQTDKEFVKYMVNLITEQERLIQELDIKRAINTVKAATKENKLPVKLAIAHNCNADTRELFLCEGESAGGSIKMARNKNFQEVLPLKGKGMNAFKAQYSDLLNNKEIVDIFLSIGAMESTNTTPRCKSVFILADADNDGKHISALLLSMFAVVYPSFVRNFNLYIVEPPLFTLISDDIRMYGHTVKDLTKKFKDKYKSRQFDIYRNKGLGEMNASELEEFIHPKTRSVKKMELSDISISELMKLMGDFTDVRKLILEDMQSEEHGLQ